MYCLGDKKISGVVFDLDDTLYPEESYVNSGFKAVCDAFGADYELMMSFYREDSKGVFDRTIERQKLNCTPAQMHELYVKYPPKIELYDGALDCIFRLRDMGFKLAVITDGRPVQQNNKLDALKIRQYFDSIIITDEFGVENRKPSPLAYVKTAQRLGLPITEICYVGDNPSKDFVVGKSHSFATVMVKSDGIYKQAKCVCSADYQINSLSELADLFVNRN